MAEFRIIDDSFTFRDDVTISASSEDVNFPASDIKQQVRSKVWRSKIGGQFIIDATNNKINFKESGGGGELTATITVDTYEASALVTEIKTQMELAGAETYTITFSLATGLWTFASGGSFLSLLWLTGTDTATSIGVTLGFENTDDTGSTSYTGAAIAIHTEEEVLIDIKTEDAIDTFAMIFDPFEGPKFSPFATLKLQSSATPDFSAPITDTTLTIDETNQAVTQFFTTDVEARFWRVLIIDPTNANLQVEVSKLILGKRIALTPNPEIGFTYDQRDQSRRNKTMFGHQYFDVYPVMKGFGFNFKVMDFPDIEVLADSYNQNGNTQIVFLAIDPTETLFDKERFSIYGFYKGQLKHKQIFTTFFDDTLSIEETF